MHHSFDHEMNDLIEIVSSSISECLSRECIVITSLPPTQGSREKHGNISYSKSPLPHVLRGKKYVAPPSPLPTVSLMAFFKFSSISKCAALKNCAMLVKILFNSKVY